MNNSWGPPEYYQQQGNMMGIGPPPPQPLMQNQMGMPPMGMMGMGDMNPTGQPGSMIRPMKPNDFSSQSNIDKEMGDGQGDSSSRSNRDRGKNRERDRSRHGDHDRRNDDRNSRDGRNDNRDSRFSRNRRNDRGSKWDSNEKERPALLPAPGQPPLPPGPMPPGPMPPGPMIPGPLQPPPIPINAGPPGNMGVPGPGGITPYNNMMGPNMDMSNMGNMSNIMPGMSGLMPMSGMPNMMDQNQMMMMNMMMMQQQQALYITNAVLLPPQPGASLPNRRERPENCRTIFVGGLPDNANEEIVKEIFSKFGNLTEVRQYRPGIYHVRFESPDSVEATFVLSGYRFRYNNQMDNEATVVFIDYALNREDQAEFERKKRREPTPPRVEPYTPQALTTLTDKIKSDEQFYESAPTLVAWMERGECNKKNANTFYSMIQSSNNHTRRLFCEKMQLDEEFATMKNQFKTKFQKVVVQFEQVEKILTAAKHQRVSDHFTKQQRRNIEMWLKMTEEVENIKEEFNANFGEEEFEKPGKETVNASKYEALKAENEKLSNEVAAYKNEAYLAKNEAEIKFEKFKAQFIAQQALSTGKPPVFPPLPPAPPLPAYSPRDRKHDVNFTKVAASEARLISILTAFLLVHPLGASLDYLVSYVRSMIPNTTQEMVNEVLNKYPDVFCRKISGIGANIGHTWAFVTFDNIKGEK